MLIILREPGQGVLVNGELEITVLSIAGGRVKLGFDGPEKYSLERKELEAERQLEEWLRLVDEGDETAIARILQTLQIDGATKPTEDEVRRFVAKMDRAEKPSRTDD